MNRPDSKARVVIGACLVGVLAPLAYAGTLWLGTRRGRRQPVLGSANAPVHTQDMVAGGCRDRDLLVAATDRLRQVFQASPCGCVLLALDGTISQANPAFEVLVGRSDLVGKHLSQVVDVAEQHAIALHLEALLKADGDDQMVAQWATRTRSGTTYLSVSSLLLRTPDGRPEHVLLNCFDDSGRHHHEAELAFVSNHDMLTGLTNRRSFVAALGAQVDLCQRYGPDGALLLVSLDAFQKVNDTFGYAAGDALLIDLAEMLRDRLRAADVVARLGGDEFAILLPRTNRAGALEVAQHIRLLVRTRITTPDGAHPVSASIGVVVIDGDDAQQLLLRAEQAVQEAKLAGRDCLFLATR